MTVSLSSLQPSLHWDVHHFMIVVTCILKDVRLGSTSTGISSQDTAWMTVALQHVSTMKVWRAEKQGAGTVCVQESTV